MLQAVSLECSCDSLSRSEGSVLNLICEDEESYMKSWRIA
jgi:hypothetical protein